METTEVEIGRLFVEAQRFSEDSLSKLEFEIYEILREVEAKAKQILAEATQEAHEIRRQAQHATSVDQDRPGTAVGNRWLHHGEQRVAQGTGCSKHHDDSSERTRDDPNRSFLKRGRKRLNETTETFAVRVALQAPKMVKSALHTRTIFSRGHVCHRTAPRRSAHPTLLPSEGAHAGESPAAIDPFDVGSFDLVRKFVEQVVAKNTSGAMLGNGRSFGNAIDWEAVEASVADSRSFEQAIGRAVVLADQMCRGVFDDAHAGRSSSSLKTEDPFFAFSLVDVVPDFGDESRYRTRLARRVARIFGIRRTVMTLAVSLVLVALPIALYQITRQGPSASASYGALADEVLAGNAQLQNGTTSNAAVAPPPVTTAPPAAAPPSLADAPPLRPHEVFGFAPYWTLDQSAGFNVNQISTIAYFSIDVNPDGTLSESGPGWNGYQSQALSSLITRAHAAGDRVVLTVTCFNQSALDQLTSSTSAPSTLTTALIGALRAKNLDGVNLDLEGSGSADQTGLTKLVSQVSAAIHGVNSNYQVTMDTYASSAGDPSGFYNIRALAPAVDGFFVMEYQLNLQSEGSAMSPLTSTMFSDRTAVDQYLAAVPASKVLLGPALLRH